MIHYKTFGTSENRALFLGSSLGTSSNMWGNIVADLAEKFFVVSFDTRGHGQSASLGMMPTSVEQFAKDVIEIADHLNIDKFSYAGVSLGGAIGQELAINYPERITKLILCCTAAKFGETKFWKERGEKVLDGGLGAILEATESRWFNPGTAEVNPFAKSLLDELLTMNPIAYDNVCQAVGDFDARDSLRDIKTPTLLLAGSEDLSTPVAVMQELANAISSSKLIVVDGAAHLGTVEKPEEFKKAILDFA